MTVMMLKKIIFEEKSELINFKWIIFDNLFSEKHETEDSWE